MSSRTSIDGYQFFGKFERKQFVNLLRGGLRRSRSLVASLAVILLVSAPASAAPVRALVPTVELTTTVASLDGKPGALDLSEGWGTARMCIATRNNTIDCFTSIQAGEAKSTQYDSLSAGDNGDVVALGPGDDCAGVSSRYLRLYEHINRGGNSIQYNDVAYYQAMPSSWQRRVSSAENFTQCHGKLAEGGGGNYSVLQVNAGLYISNLHSYSWGDRATHVCLTATNYPQCQPSF